MPEFLFSIGAAYAVGDKPRVTIAFPPGTSFVALPIEVAMVMVNEVNAQIRRLVQPQAPAVQQESGTAQPPKANGVDIEEKSPP